MTVTDGTPIRDSVTYKGVEVLFDFHHRKHYYPRLECCFHHFEFHSKAVSPTGYYSWFVPCAHVEAAGGYKEAALLFVEKHFHEPVRQCSLFD